MEQLSDEEIIKQAHEIYRRNWIDNHCPLFAPGMFKESAQQHGHRLNIDVAMKQLQRISCRM